MKAFHFTAAVNGLKKVPTYCTRVTGNPIKILFQLACYVFMYVVIFLFVKHMFLFKKYTLRLKSVNHKHYYDFPKLNDHCRKTNLSELFNEQLNTAINNMFLHSFLHIVSASGTVHSSELLSLNPQHISHNGLIRFPECHPNQSLRHSNQGSCQALKPIQRMQSVC